MHKNYSKCILSSLHFHTDFICCFLVLLLTLIPVDKFRYFISSFAFDFRDKNRHTHTHINANQRNGWIKRMPQRCAFLCFPLSR